MELRELVEELRQDWEEYRNQNINEQSTRDAFINRILDALGWEHHNLRKVRPEYTSSTGRADYALIKDGKPILFIEAKTLNDSLKDPKTIGQVDAYTSCEGLKYYILTNGMQWKVYDCSFLKPAPDKIVMDIDLRIEDYHKGVKALEVFTFGNDFNKNIQKEISKEEVEKAIKGLMNEPSNEFIKSIKQELPVYKNISREDIKTVLKELKDCFASGEVQMNETIKESVIIDKPPELIYPDTNIDPEPELSVYTEEMHLEGKSQVLINSYRKIDSFINNLSPDLTKEYNKMTLNWTYKNKTFCWLHIGRIGSIRTRALQIWLVIDYDELISPPEYIRSMIKEDGSKIGHYGSGSIEIKIEDTLQVEPILNYIKQAFDKVKSQTKQ